MSSQGFPVNRSFANVINAGHLFGENQAALLSSLGFSGVAFYTSPSGSDGNNDGQSPQTAFATVSYAVGKMKSGDALFLLPGRYDGGLITIARTDSDAAARANLLLYGLGGRGAAYIQPSVEDQAAMVIHADDVTLVNVGVAAEDETSAVSLTITGARFRAYGCKFEAGAEQVRIGPGTAALKTAGTQGGGADSLFDDCEFAWGTKGLVLQGTDYGGCTQTYVRGCRFHDLTAESVGEKVGSGGTAAVTFFGLNVKECVFETAEDGTVPTKWFSLNANNANTGIVSNCQIPSAINGGKNLVSTKVLWVSNFHTGGVSTGQPS